MTESLDERLIELLSQDAQQNSQILAKQLNVKEGDLRPEDNSLGRIMGVNPSFQGASLLEGHWERTD